MKLSTLIRAAGLLLCAGCALTPARAAHDPQWTDAWRAGPDSPGPALQAQTLRQVIRSSIGGARAGAPVEPVWQRAAAAAGREHLPALVDRGVDDARQRPSHRFPQ